MAFTAFHGPDFAFESLKPDDGPLQGQLVAWHRRAVAAGRVPCMYLTAGWCPPSVRLEKSLTDPRMQQAFRDVDAATLDIDTWGDSLTAAGFRVTTVPMFHVIDAAGQCVGPEVGGGAWGENTVENMAPPLERFFDAARAARPAPPVVVPATPAAPSKLLGILMLVAGLVLLAGAAYYKVSSEQAENRQKADSELQDRIRRDLERSLQKKP